MVQESTMICIDNSEYMRNGDFAPTRLSCEQEAANLVAQVKLRANPENAVGLLSMADDVRVLSTMTQEDRKLFCRLHEIDFEGTIKLLPAIKVAHLALKHRQNRNHKMRIVLFVGSPVEGVVKSDFIKLAKKLKKEKVNVDIVSFGEAAEENNELLQEFVDTLNGKEGDGSNLVIVSQGSLREALSTSAVCRAEGMGGAVANGGFDFAMNGEEDPELDLALRVSLEEQRARQRQEEEAPAHPAAADEAAPAPAVDEPLHVDPEAMTEEQQLELALRMSMQDAVPQPQQNPSEPEAMDVDTPSSSGAAIGEIVTDANALNALVEGLDDDEKSEGAKKSDDANKTDK
uniref:26S proteasome non-ATPase regulatory subunit 4 n=1 Tax=Panagrellus redivivus TaxID=6233 RepID=A0A7E4US23_PANRE